ncbi:MAG: hypothetical protein HY329_26485, partial [Chloroflexi bacterium]|nr:hypothetical protein [Chloroflexota bacterium]
KGVRTFVSNDQVNTEWQLAWEPTATLPAFPEGTIDVYSSVEAGSTYDGWDRFGSFQLQR